MAVKSPSYLEHFETLTALVTHLAMTDWSLRTPRNLAKALSINESEITRVLDGFKGLFRKSPNLSKKHQSPMYALQLRHARQWLEGEATDEEVTKPPLEPDYLIALLEFITHRANEEARRSYTITATLIASGLAMIASFVSLGVALFPALN